MLLSELNDTRAELSKLGKKENAIQNAEKKAKNDKDYSKLIDNFFESMNLLKYAYDEIGYILSVDTINLINDTILKLNEIVEYGAVDEDLLSDVKRKEIKQLNTKLVNEWDFFYKKEKSSAIGKLNTIGFLDFDRNQIEQIKKNISDSCNWNGLSKEKIESFKSSIDRISKIEENLKLNSNISTFIMKVTQGKAKITDLNEEILSWIKGKELDDKFLIRFK